MSRVVYLLLWRSSDKLEARLHMIPQRLGLVRMTLQVGQFDQIWIILSMFVHFFVQNRRSVKLNQLGVGERVRLRVAQGVGGGYILVPRDNRIARKIDQDIGRNVTLFAARVNVHLQQINPCQNRISNPTPNIIKSL